MRILIADDHALVRENFRDFLIREIDGAAIDEADSFRAIGDALARYADYDLIIVDLNMPGMEGRESIARINSAHPKIPIIVFSGSYEPEQINKMITAGASGFIPKTVSGDTMKTAIDLVLAGGTYIPKEALNAGTDKRSKKEAPHDDLLTPRESDVLRELLNGNSNREIAEALGVKDFTVKAHMQNIFRKFDADNRTQVIIKAIELGYQPDA